MVQTKKIFMPHLSTASDARAVRTRQALRQALLGLLESRPWEQITIRDIAATAGIGYTTFFRHHSTKEALLDDLAAEEIQRLIDLAIPIVEAESPLAASEALFEHVHQHRALWSTLLTGGAASTLREALLHSALQYAASQPQAGHWLMVELATRLLVGGTIEVLAWWLRQSEPLPVKEVAELHLRAVILPHVVTNWPGQRRKPEARVTRRPKRSSK